MIPDIHVTRSTHWTRALVHSRQFTSSHPLHILRAVRCPLGRRVTRFIPESCMRTRPHCPPSSAKTGTLTCSLLSHRLTTSLRSTAILRRYYLTFLVLTLNLPHHARLTASDPHEHLVYMLFSQPLGLPIAPSSAYITRPNSVLREHTSSSLPYPIRYICTSALPPPSSPRHPSSHH